MATGPCLRTASRYPASPLIRPPARQMKQYQPSAAMNALVSALITAAVTGQIDVREMV